MAELLVVSTLLAVSVGTHFDHPARSEAILISDISQISSSWGQISPYTENAENYFGVESVGMPSGCQIVS